MSVQTELTRITNAKAAIKTAIEGKGVTVPDGTLLDGMAALIESIEAGGGGGFATGTLTFNELQSTCSNLTVTHNLGFAPEHILWFIIETEATSSGKVFASNYPICFEYISKEAYLVTSDSRNNISNVFKYSINTSEGSLNLITRANSNAETIDLFFNSSYRYSNNIPASSTLRRLVW